MVSRLETASRSECSERTRMISWTSVLVAVAAVSVTSAQTYTNRWDNIDVEPILRNERLIKTYFRCLMDQGKCSPEATELKKNLPDALETGCCKCTDKQRTASEKILNIVFLEQHKPMFKNLRGLLKEMEAKYDPKGVYRAKYTEEAKKQGFQVTGDEVKAVGPMKKIEIKCNQEMP